MVGLNKAIGENKFVAYEEVVAISFLFFDTPTSNAQFLSLYEDDESKLSTSVLVPASSINKLDYSGRGSSFVYVQD